MGAGMPWFMLDCQLDDKFDLIEAEFGIKGFAVIVKLLQKIYGGEGYYCEWTNDVGLMFSKKMNEGFELVSEIVSASIRRGIFSKELYDKYQILTSKGIQKRYLKAASRRQNVTIEKKYLLVEVGQKYKNVDILSENDDISHKNDDISEQRREENRIEDKSIEEERKVEDFAQDAKIAIDNSVPKQTAGVNNRDVMKALDYYRKYIGEPGAEAALGLTQRLKDGMAIEDIFARLEFIGRNWDNPTPTWDEVRGILHE